VLLFVSGAEVAVWLVVASLLWFAHPMADDFCRAAATREQGIIDGVTKEYLTNSGRWAGIGLVYAISTFADLTGIYPSVLGVIIVVSTLGWVAFARSILGPGIPASTAWFVGSSLLLMHWAGIRPPGETYYWLTGAVENQLSLGLAASLLAGVIHQTREAEKKHPLLLPTPILVVGAFAVTALHELYGLMLVVILLSGSLIAWLWDHRRWPTWGIVGLGALVGLVVVLVAPGNFARAARRGGHGDLAMAAATAFSQAAKRVTFWLIDLRLWAATMALLSPRLDAGQIFWDRLSQLRFVLPVGFGILLGLGFFVPSTALGAEAPGRTVNALYLLFLVGWGVTILAWRGRLLLWMKAVSSEQRERLSIMAVVTLGAGIMLYGSLPRAMIDLATDLREYDVALEARYSLIRAASARAIRDVEVPALSTYPRSFVGRGWDITNDSQNWRNRCVADFFVIRSIRVPQ
jgi:hypothetical protein